MPIYRIYSTQIVESVVDVEAEDARQAIELFNDGDGELVDEDAFLPEIQSIIELG